MRRFWSNIYLLPCIIAYLLWFTNRNTLFINHLIIEKSFFLFNNFKQISCRVILFIRLKKSTITILNVTLMTSYVCSSTIFKHDYLTRKKRLWVLQFRLMESQMTQVTVQIDWLIYCMCFQGSKELCCWICFFLHFSLNRKNMCRTSLLIEEIAQMKKTANWLLRNFKKTFYLKFNMSDNENNFYCKKKWLSKLVKASMYQISKKKKQT